MSAEAATMARVLLEVARSHRPVSFVARGGSMWPAIPSGSVLTIIPSDPRTLRPGDVAAFERDGAIVTHRVLRTADTGLRCRGDALPDADAEVPFASVLGRVTVTRRAPIALRWPRLRHLVRLARAARVLVTR